MKIDQPGTDEALLSVRSTRAGLSSLEVERRLREHGLNAVRAARRESVW